MPEPSVLLVHSGHYRRLYQTDVGDGVSITEPTQTTTMPVAGDNGIINLGEGGSVSPAGIILAFYAIGNTPPSTGAVKVYGWNELPAESAGQKSAWIPTCLFSGTGITTAGGTTQPGVANTPIPATQYLTWAYTMTAGSVGTAGVDWALSTVASGGIMHLMVCPKGAKFLDVRLADGNATAINGVWRPC